MCVPTSEVGYTSAMPRREDHEVHKDMWGGHWREKYIYIFMMINILITETNNEWHVNWPHTNVAHVHTGLSKTVYSHIRKKLTQQTLPKDSR